MTEESSGDTAAGIAEIENTMRTDFRSYERDKPMQTRYAELLSARDAGESPQAANPVDAELATIQQRMKSDFGGYMNDKPMQDRYMALLTEQGQVAAAPESDAQNVGDHSTKHTVETAVQAGGPNVGTVELHNVKDMITNFEAEPETAALLKSWGADAEENVQFAAVESAEILNRLSPEAARSLFDAAEDLPAADYANLMRSLADAGRAKRTR